MAEVTGAPGAASTEQAPVDTQSQKQVAPTQQQVSHQVREVLPGVMSDPGFDPDQPQSTSPKYTSKAEMREAFERGETGPSEVKGGVGVQAERDEKGRFISKEGSGDQAPDDPNAKPAGEPAAAPDEPPLVAPTPALAPASFKVGALTFQSEQQAEQAMKTFRGQAQSTARQLAEAQAELARLRQAPAPPSSTSVTAPNQSAAQPRDPGSSEGALADKGFLASLTEDHQQTLQQIVADPEGGQLAATAYLLELHNEYVTRKFDELRAPAVAAEAQQKVVQEVNGLWQQALDYSDEAGTPYFPELRDPEAIDNILRIYQRMVGKDNGRALDPQIVYASIMTHRANSARAQGQARAQASPSTPVENILPDPAEPPRRPSLLPNSPVPTPAQRGGEPGVRDAGDEVRRAIRQAGNFDSGLRGVNP